MLKHIVMWKIKDVHEGTPKEELIAELTRRLKELKTSVPGVQRLEVGRNVSPRPTALDLVLVTEFKDDEALQHYRNHPAHLEVVEYVKKVAAAGYVVDYHRA
ncbi:MAG: Dabb family protein [Candidatus Omnitrophica bacterium]|nr:Dabb family protein [Candidatus Omnitrophota bacterium]